MSKSAHRFDKNKSRQTQPRGAFDDWRGEERQDRRHTAPAPLTPQTENQKRYLSSIRTNDITFGLGPAGTGKTYVAVAYAADWLKEATENRLIVTRPAVEAGDEAIGFLPGDMGEKFDPFMRPVLDVLNERLGASYVEALRRAQRIEFAPLGYMRGASFQNVIAILDEAQNTSPSVMKMFLTRIGKQSKLIVNGDLKQSDIKGTNGLWDATRRLRDIKGIGQTTFTRDDIVRHGLVRDIIDRYEDGDYQNDDQPALPGFITGPTALAA